MNRRSRKAAAGITSAMPHQILKCSARQAASQIAASGTQVINTSITPRRRLALR